uniref:restriction endonuclease subunit S n=1 Tax=Bacteroides ovatus TaxID=28116 RepID=UPI0022E2088D
NVPHLRFPEFSWEWEKCSIQDYGEVVTGNTPPTSHAEYYENGSYLWASPADLGINKNITETKTKLSLSGFKKTRNIPKGSVLVTCIGSTIGKMGMATETMSSNQQINSIVVNDKSNSDFVYYAICRAFPRYLSEVGVQAVPILSKSNFEKLPNYTTCRDEQDKIGYFLNLLDERIATQNKIIEDLKKLKSAIIDKSFCYPNESSPQKRLTGFTDEWLLVQLSDICQRVRTKNANNQCTSVLTIAAQFGLVSQEDFFNKSVASDNLGGYYLLQKGDFAYNKSYSGDYAWGAVKRLECYSEGVLSPLYICFRPDTRRIDSDFLAHYFESKKWYKGIADIAGEGVRNHGLLNLSVNDYFKTIHRIPSLQEQKAIANVLNKLTSKISIEKKLYDDLLLQRQYLLQQMFI